MRAMFRVQTARFVAFFALLILSACSGEDSSGETTCDPGRSIECFCPDGLRGSQRCFTDGSSYGRCMCSGEVGDVDEADCRDRDCGDSITDPDLEAAHDEASEADESEDCGAAGCPEDLRWRDLPPDTPEGETVDDEVDAPTVDTTVDPDEEDDPSDAISVMRRLGETCERAAECDTDICLGLDMGGGLTTMCATPCCHEEECPYGFGCLQAGAGRYCLPARIFPDGRGYTLTSPTGESCGYLNNACKSGICETSNDMCRGTCCTDSDCGRAPCSWSTTGSSQRTFCDPLGLLRDPVGSGCTSQWDCSTGVCVQVSPGVGQCASLCCTSFDCPGELGCGLVGNPGGDVVRACVALPTGDKSDGEACSDDGESCASGHCVEGHCRSLCCTDSNCTLPERCLPRDSNEGVMTPVCIRPGE